MPEWWSYSPSDLLLFSPRTYYRLFELHNAAAWPWQALTLLLGVVILVLLRRPGAWQGRAISGIIALLWAWVAWAFLWKRYATINRAAVYVAAAFAIEALLLTWIGVVRGRVSFRRRGDAATIVGSALFIFALAVYPMLARLFGRAWSQAEVFGVAPDPTATATLGLLLLMEGRARRALFVVPLLWCVLSAATLWTMGAADAWIPALAALIVSGCAFPWRGATRAGEESFMGAYRATIEWERQGAVFVDNRYGRGHEWEFDGGIRIRGSASPQVVPLPFSEENAVDPEEALVAAISSCHMLSFLFIVAKRKYVVDRYHDEAVGTMGRNAEGKLAMLEVTLRPVVTFADDGMPDDSTFLAIHEEAHEECFIASSVKTVVRCEPVSRSARLTRA